MDVRGLDELSVVKRARELGRKAIAKKPPYGPDIDVEKLIEEPPTGTSGVEEFENTASSIGLDPAAALKRGYVQVDETIILEPALRMLESHGVRVMTTGEALKRFELARKLYWSLISPDEDKYTGVVAAYWRGHGYFIYVPDGVRLREPIYACLFIARQGYPQILHNIVYVGDNAEVHLITGCATARRVTRALHISVTEIYVGRGSKLTYSMIHSWAPQVHVRPRSSVLVGRASSYTSYYIVFSSVASIQQYPRVRLEENATASTITIVAGRGSSIYDLGTEASLAGYNSSAKIVSRLVAWDEAKLVSRARIKALARGRGHIECSGLQLGERAVIETIPELYSEAPGADLTHEAAIGRIAEEELEYLMARGLSEDEALTMILHGFLAVEEPGLPLKVKKIIDATVRILAERRGM